MKVSDTKVLAGLFSFMGQIRLGLGQVNITDYLIVIARKTTTPGIIEAQEAYAPPQPATRNVVVPAVGSIDPVIYYVDVRESPNGVTLGLLLAQFVYDLKNNVIIAERRYYLVDGPGANDPASGQNILSDAYLNGKTISGVFKEGFRYLVPDPYTNKEYDLHPGGGIELLNGKDFGTGEVWMVEISYLANQTIVSGIGLYDGVITITANTVLDPTHRNKRLKCESNASSQLVVTLEDVTTVPDKTIYHFTSNGGNQFQTRILPAAGQIIGYNGEGYTEMTLAKGEFIRIENVGGTWEATMVHPGVLQVGEHISGTWKDHPNTKPEDGTLYDGDDWPRPWWWIKTKLPVTHYIIDDNVVNGGYVHPAGKEGLFVIHSTLKKFRMPNTQKLSERGLKNFTGYNTDGTRVYDYPGGVQNEMVGPANINTIAWTGSGKGKTNLTVDSIGFLATEGDGGEIDTDSQSNTNRSGARTNPWTIISPDNENRVKNIGVIYLRRF